MDLNVAWLTTNRNCNLACSWCYAQDFFEVSNKMDYELAKKMIDICVTAGVRKFFLIGGEPTIYPELFKIIGYIATFNLEVVIVTNGLLLGNEEFCKKIEQVGYSKIHFGISLKGASDAEYVKNCKKNGFELVLQGISNCERYGFNYSLSYVLTAENIDEIDLFAKRIAETGIKQSISFQICNDVITNDGIIIENKSHPLKIDKGFAKKYDDVCAHLDDNFYLHQIFPLCQCDQELLKKMRKKNQITTACHVHERNGVIFDIDGSLLLCNHLAGFGFGKFGEDFKDYRSFYEFWESPKVVDLHKKFTTMPSLECEKCNTTTECGGGCCNQWFSNDFSSFEKYNELEKRRL